MTVDERLANATPGTEIGPIESEVSAGWNARLVEASGASPRHDGQVDPVMAGQLALAVYAACVPGPMIHAVQRTRHRGVLAEDSAVHCSGRVEQRYAKRGRPYVEMSFQVTLGDSAVWDGTILCTNPNTSCEGLPDAPDAARPALDGTDEIATLEHAFDLESMTRFSGPGNIHSDYERARAVGLDRPVVQGMQVASLCDRLLRDRWEDAWPERGEWEVRFVGMAWAEEKLRATLITPSTPDPPTRGLDDQVGLRVTKADGTVCIVGWSGLHPLPPE